MLNDVAAPEIARAAATYEPRFGSMAAEDVARGRALVHDALAGLQVVPVVNRWTRPDTVEANSTDAFLGTVHTLPPRHVVDRGMHVVRQHWEQARGTYGEGELAGRTVFASAQFVPRDRIDANGGDVVAALGEVAAARGGWGVARFGERANVLDPAVLARATASGRDSGMGVTPAGIAPVDRLDDVVLERLARSNGFQRDAFTAVNDYRMGVGSDGTAPERRSALRTLLHETPAEAAVTELRRYLTGPATTDISHMVELQIRGVRGSDVLASVPEPAAAHVNPVGI